METHIKNKMKNKLSKNLKTIVYDYLLPKSEYIVTEDMALMAVLMQASRFLCWNRVLVEGQNGLEPAALYALNFAPSGAGKDASIKSVAKLNKKAFDMMASRKKRDFESRKQKYISVNDNRVTKKMTEGMFKKELWWHNTFSGGTIQGMYSERAKISMSDFGSLHFESSEFLDKLKEKGGESEKIFTYMKEAYEEGNTSTDSIMGEMRDNVEKIYMTMYVHGSSMGLKEDGELLKGFLNIFGTGIARRSFCLFSTKKHVKEYTEKEAIKMMYDSEKGFKKSEKIMYDAFYSVYMVDDKVKIKGYADIFGDILKYKNMCKKRWGNTDSEILAPEIKDRYWRALRLAACIALIEHPGSLKITKEDYELAVYLCERWGGQFENFIKKQIEDSHNMLYEFIKDSDGVNKTQIREAMKYGNNTRQLDIDLNIVKEMAIDKNMVLSEKKGARGRSMYYSLIPLHLLDLEENIKKQDSGINIDEINFN